MLTSYYIAINLITFGVWVLDKYRAIQQQWRIPERWLYALTIFGGCFGALAGMSLFRHKTRKLHFWILGIVCSVIHIMLILLVQK